MILEIPVALDDPLFDMRISLEGVDYTFRFDYNEREGRWYLAIADIDGTWLATGIKLVSNVPLFAKRVGRGLPPGELLVIDTSGESPGFSSLGRGATVVYATSDEVQGRSLTYSEEAEDMIFTEGGSDPVILDGEVKGPAKNTHVAGLGGLAVTPLAGPNGRLLTTRDGAVVAEPLPEHSHHLASVDIPLPTDGAPKGALVYAVPPCKWAVIERIWIGVSEKLEGTGTVEIKAGTVAGGNDLLIAQNMTSATEGLISGEKTTTLGTRFPSTSYTFVAKAGDEIRATLTPSGVVTGGAVRAVVIGKVIT